MSLHKDETVVSLWIDIDASDEWASRVFDTLYEEGNLSGVGSAWFKSDCFFLSSDNLAVLIWAAILLSKALLKQGVDVTGATTNPYHTEIYDKEVARWNLSRPRREE